MVVFLRWFLICAMMIFGSIVAYMTGGVQMVLDGDITKISIIITVVAWAMTGMCGYLSFKFA